MFQFLPLIRLPFTQGRFSGRLAALMHQFETGTIYFRRLEHKGLASVAKVEKARTPLRFDHYKRGDTVRA